MSDTPLTDNDIKNFQIAALLGWKFITKTGNAEYPLIGYKPDGSGGFWMDHPVPDFCNYDNMIKKRDERERLLIEEKLNAERRVRELEAEVSVLRVKVEVRGEEEWY